MELKKSIEKVGDGFIFHNLAGFGSVKLFSRFLEYYSYGLMGNHDNNSWRDICSKRNDGVVVPNSIVLYQMAKLIYDLRNDETNKDVVNECLALFKEDWSAELPNTGTKITFCGGLDAVVHHLMLDGSDKTLDLVIPQLTEGCSYDDSDLSFSYLTLAPEQADEKLGVVNQIPDDAKPVLEALLGEGYEEAGAIFQYIFPEKDNGNLREAKIWLPVTAERNYDGAVLFGDYDDGVGIDINDNTDDDVGRSSRGIVAVASQK